MSKLIRIKAIQKMVEQESNIYDLCCDHGIIGSSFFQDGKTVHFIDSIENIMNSLRTKLVDSDIPKKCYNLITADARHITPRTRNNIYIIAGIGGELAIQIVENIILKDENPTFIVNVNNNQLKLRAVLAYNKFKLHYEEIIQENGVFHEIFKTSKFGSSQLSVIGDKMWQLDKNYIFDYLNLKIQYHQKGAKFSSHSKELLNAYLDIKSKYIEKLNN